MPIYTYQCSSCSAIFDEFWTSYSEAEEHEPKYIEEAKCPSCGLPKKTKQVTAPMVQFKGEGWTAKSIIPGGSGRQDSTDALKDHAQQVKEKTKNLTSKDLYGDIKI